MSKAKKLVDKQLMDKRWSGELRRKFLKYKGRSRYRGKWRWIMFIDNEVGKPDIVAQSTNPCDSEEECKEDFDRLMIKIREKLVDTK